MNLLKFMTLEDIHERLKSINLYVEHIHERLKFMNQ